MHILHFAFPPENFYKPIVSDSFHFWEKEYEKEYQVSFKYTDNYIIGFKDRNEKIPKFWHTYTEEQIQAVTDICALLVQEMDVGAARNELILHHALNRDA